MIPIVNAGDVIIHPQLVSFGDHSWRRKYEVLTVEVGTRFGKPDLLLRVKISCIDANTGTERVTDASKAMWLSQIG
jgi:hypothetical protein